MLSKQPHKLVPLWISQFTPKKAGGARKPEIVFVAPTGEEIKSKRQLDQYLRSNPGGPPSSEFDWGTGIPHLSLPFPNSSNV